MTNQRQVELLPLLQSLPKEQHGNVLYFPGLRVQSRHNPVANFLRKQTSM